MSYVAQDAFWCRLVQRTKCQCKEVQDSMSWKGMQANRAQSSAKVITSFRMVDLYGKKNLVRIRHKYMDHSAKIFHEDSGNSGKFLEVEEKRMLLLSHFLYYSSVSEF